MRATGADATNDARGAPRRRQINAFQRPQRNQLAVSAAVHGPEGDPILPRTPGGVMTSQPLGIGGMSAKLKAEPFFPVRVVLLAKGGFGGVSSSLPFPTPPPFPCSSLFSLWRHFPGPVSYRYSTRGICAPIEYRTRGSPASSSTTMRAIPTQLHGCEVPGTDAREVHLRRPKFSHRWSAGLGDGDKSERKYTWTVGLREFKQC